MPTSDNFWPGPKVGACVKNLDCLGLRLVFAGFPEFIVLLSKEPVSLSRIMGYIEPSSFIELNA